MRTFFRSLVFIGMLVAPALSAQAEQAHRDVITIQNGDYYGHDLRSLTNVGLDECKAACIGDESCKAFTFNSKKNVCFIKSGFDKLDAFPGGIAGKIVIREVATAPEPDLGKPPKLAFLEDYYVAQASYAKARLTTFEGQANLSREALVEISKQDLAVGAIDHAVATLKSALVLSPNDYRLWMDVAAAASRATDQWSIKEQGLLATINAYTLSRTKTERAQALAAMARALDLRDAHRDAINAYKESLKVDNNPEIANALAELRTHWGFRVTGNTVDTDAAEPRACVQFSEPLVRADVDYSDYVTVDGKAANAVSAQGSQICVEGLAHGQRYQISLRAGLPSSVDEPLSAKVDFDVYVQDRTPSVRFTGENYVLPSSVRHGIPVVSINTETINLSLYRIGERNVSSVLNNTQFLSQLYRYRADDIRNESGEAVWSGTLDVNPELNKEIVTSFPIDQVLPARKPGIYVLTATSGQKKQGGYDDMATQWFVVSDIGLNTYAGTDGLNVFARSLDTAKPLAGISLNLVAKNNEILAKAVTDGNGQAKFTPGFVRGTGGLTPAFITADNAGKDYVFLDLSRAGFDLSDRGVTGREAPGAIDIFTWTERGIYRAGETVHLASLARDISGKAIENLPLTFVVTRPDGVEDRRKSLPSGSMGGYSLDLPMDPDAMRGTWTVRVYTDPSLNALSEKTFMVEDFRPERLDLTMETKALAMQPGLETEITADGRFLYGAPASGLALEGDVIIGYSTTSDDYPGYRFGISDEGDQETTRQELEGLPALDDQGKANLSVILPDLPSTTRLLQATVDVRLREPGGRAIERTLVLPVNDGREMIGVKPEFGEAARENSIASFNVIGLDSSRKKKPMTGLSWTLLQIETEYQWYRNGSSWSYEPVVKTRAVAKGNLDLTAEGGKISTPVTWGRYRLEVESADADGPQTSVEFDAGWYVAASSVETPDALEIAFDKDSYKVGEIAKLKVSPRFAGEVMVNLGSDNIYRTLNATIPREGGIVEIPVTDEMGGGTYVTATLFRPGSDQASRMPMRAIGVKWLKIDPGLNKLAIAIKAPGQMLPRQPLTIDVDVSGSGAQQEAYITLAAVDVGILNLTGFKTPSPDEWYYGQRKLGLEIRDIYGKLIDGSLGASGRLRNGGDGGNDLQSEPPTEKLLAFFSGPVKLDAQGHAQVAFDLPQFNGTARIMAVAWSKSGVGHADTEVVIRDPVVVTASMPQFLAPGDKAELRLDIANTDGPAGNYQLAIQENGLVKIDRKSIPKEIKLEPKGKTGLVLNVTAGDPQKGSVDIRIMGPDGIDVGQSVDLAIRPSTLPATERRLVRIDPGKHLLIDDNLLADSIIAGASITTKVTKDPVHDIASVLMTLDRYPYGCAEQTTSRALPLLYLSDLSAKAGIPDDKEVPKRIQDAIDRVLSYQSSSGSFGLWEPGSGDFWLDDFVTDFLTRAREKKFAVPELALTQALDNLENQLAYDNDVSVRGNEMAYAIYVLARNRRAAISDLRYYADTMIDKFPTSLAKAQIAAALSLYGDKARAERIFGMLAGNSSTLLTNVDYGSRLRDNAAILALASESRMPDQIIEKFYASTSASWITPNYLSTQEQTWLVMASRAISAQDDDIRISVNGAPKEGAFQQQMTGEALLQSPMTIANNGKDAVTAVVTSVASPKAAHPEGGNGLSITKAYYTLDGEETDISEIRQNERYVVVLTVKPYKEYFARLMISDLLPAGLDIDNPGLVNSASLANFDWLPETSAAHLEFRSDRFLAAIDNASGSGNDIVLAYVVRATNPGTFARPGAFVEDMYHPEINAYSASGTMRVAKD